MKVSLSILVVFCGLATSSSPVNVAGGARACEDHAALLSLTHEYEGIFLGEYHGQRQSVEVIGCLIEAVLGAGRQVEVSLEVFEKENFLLEGSRWGRRGANVGSDELRAILVDFAGSGNVSVSYHLPPTQLRADGSIDSQKDEETRANAILDSLDRGNFLIALSGWRHAQRKRFYEAPGQEVRYAGDYMPNSVANVKLVARAGGNSRYCSLSGCGVQDLHPVEDCRFSETKLVHGEEWVGFDYCYDVGEFTPIR